MRPTAGGADALGRHVPHRRRAGRARGPRAPGAYHRIAFHGPDGPVFIETTRPELLPACVALVAHPDDERYQPLFGTTVRTPLFGVEVPVVAHHLAEPDKGSGIAMICTFGDLTDVTWWRELDLPTRADHRPRTAAILADPPPGGARAGRTRELAGKTCSARRSAIVELLRESGDLDGEPRPITHPVKFYEKGDRPLEIVTTRQWYIRNGGRDEELRDALLARGPEIHWLPPFMRHRYENWVDGLNGDWLISRQRFFGVPFPVWYRLDAERRARLRPPDPAARGRAAGRPVVATSRRATPRTSAASPAGSSATPTSWTPGRRRR